MLTLRKPSPTGVVIGPFSATRVLRMEVMPSSGIRVTRWAMGVLNEELRIQGVGVMAVATATPHSECTRQRSRGKADADESDGSSTRDGIARRGTTDEIGR